MTHLLLNFHLQTLKIRQKQLQQINQLLPHYQLLLLKTRSLLLEASLMQPSSWISSNSNELLHYLSSILLCNVCTSEESNSVWKENRTFLWHPLKFRRHILIDDTNQELHPVTMLSPMEAYVLQWNQTCAHTRAYDPDLLARTGMDIEFPRIWHVVGWNGFILVNESSSRFLTIQFHCTLCEVSV